MIYLINILSQNMKVKIIFLFSIINEIESRMKDIENIQL